MTSAMTKQEPLIDFQVHTIATAPEASQALLQNSLKTFGMIPNLHGVMAESAPTLEGYQMLTKLAIESSFTPTERHVLWLAINVENQCHYCVPAHTLLAKKDAVKDEIIDAIRNGQPLPDARLETLRQFALRTLAHRGHVPPAEVEAFLGAGFTQAQALEVVLIIAHKVMSNFINAFASTEVDAPFAKYAWEQPDQ